MRINRLFLTLRSLAAVALIAILLPGCGTTTGLSAEQIKAMEGQSSSICVRAPGWNGSQIEIHYASFGGKATGTAGGGGKTTCGASVAEFTNEGKLPPPPKVTTTVTTTPQ